jgi:hypothetical protein
MMKSPPTEAHGAAVTIASAATRAKEACGLTQRIWAAD